MNSELKQTPKSDYKHEQDASDSSITKTSKIVAADPTQAEEVPTIPIDSLELVAALQPAVSVHSVETTYFPHLPTPLVAQPSEYQRSLGEWCQIWWDGVRPSYLSLSLLPTLLGITLAWTHTINIEMPLGQLHFKHMMASIVVALLIQMGGHLVNDYYDYLRRVDTGNIFGSGGLIQQRYVKPTLILKIGLILLGTGALFGLILWISGGVLMCFFGLLMVLGAYFYSAPPRPLSSIGLGEITGFVLFGPLLTLSAYMAQTGGTFPASAVIYSLPSGLLAAAVIHTNNMRDSETDANAQKQTFANLKGTKASRILYLLLLLAVYGIVGVLGIAPQGPHLVLITFWTLPLVVVAISGIIYTKSPAGFHMVLQETLRIQTYFVLLLMVSLAMMGLLPVLPHLPAHLLPF